MPPKMDPNMFISSLERKNMSFLEAPDGFAGAKKARYRCNYCENIEYRRISAINEYIKKCKVLCDKCANTRVKFMDTCANRLESNEKFETLSDVFMSIGLRLCGTEEDIQRYNRTISSETSRVPFSCHKCSVINNGDIEIRQVLRNKGCLKCKVSESRKNKMKENNQISDERKAEMKRIVETPVEIDKQNGIIFKTDGVCKFIDGYLKDSTKSAKAVEYVKFECSCGGGEFECLYMCFYSLNPRKLLFGGQQRCEKCRNYWKKEGCLRKYNNIYAIASDEVMAKIKETLMEKTGYDCNFKNPEVWRKRNDTMMALHGTIHALQNPTSHDKMQKSITKTFMERRDEIVAAREKTSMDIYGTRVPSQSQQVKDKIVATNMSRIGARSNLCGEFRANMRDIWLDKWGVDNPMKLQRILEKNQATVKQRYNVTNVAKLDWVHDKQVQTCLEKYGEKYPLQNEKCMKKLADTCMERYGKEYYCLTDEFKIKSEKTCLERYGVRHAMQNDVIFAKVMKNAYTRKPHTFASGRVDMVQGYESFCLSILEYEYLEDSIITDYKLMPRITYIMNDNQHRYYPDIYIDDGGYRKFIEVKSTYTFQVDPERIMIKKQACIDLGFPCEIWVFDKNGKLVDKIE